jgi:hypothetical protein
MLETTEMEPAWVERKLSRSNLDLKVIGGANECTARSSVSVTRG